jgi:hypothetical protein
MVDLDMDVIPNIPPAARNGYDWFDITLAAGDILVLPELWLHTVQNLDRLQMAVSYRYANHFYDMFRNPDRSIYLKTLTASLVGSIPYIGSGMSFAEVAITSVVTSNPIFDQFKGWKGPSIPVKGPTEL